MTNTPSVCHGRDVDQEASNDGRLKQPTTEETTMATKAKKAKTTSSKAKKATTNDDGKTTNDGGSGSGKTTSATSRTSRGPALYWNPTRDKALVTAAADLASNGDAMTKAALHERLSSHAAFKDAGEALTEDKVRDRVLKLRKRGVNLPQIQRPAGGWTRYSPDVDELNKVIEETKGE